MNEASVSQTMSMPQQTTPSYTYEQLGYVYAPENDCLNQLEPVFLNPLICMNAYWVELCVSHKKYEGAID